MSRLYLFYFLCFMSFSLFCQEHPDPWYIARIFNRSNSSILIKDCDDLTNRIEYVTLEPNKDKSFRIEDAHLIEFKTPKYYYIIALQENNRGLLQQASNEFIPKVLGWQLFPVQPEHETVEFQLIDEQLRLISHKI